MRLEPGPLTPLPELQPEAAVEPGGFGDLARSEMQQTSAWDGDLLGALGTINADWVERPGDSMREFIDPALAYANELAMVDGPSQFSDVDGQSIEGDGMVLQGYGTTPGEAWEPVPGALQVPNTPQIPPQPGTVTVTIGKIGAPTDQNFRVGDTYEIRCTVVQPVGGGAEIANLLLQRQSFLRAGDPSTMDIGRTSAAGILIVQRVWAAADVGQWYISWIVQGTTIGVNAGNASFIVQPASTGGGGGGVPTVPITVAITNLVTGSHTVFRPNQDFTLTVTGAPNSQVVVTFQPGSKYTGSGLLGSTDATGRLDYSGRYLSSDIGHYILTYTVGGVAWSGQLVLDVVA
jgi:hypothetical protein